MDRSELHASSCAWEITYALSSLHTGGKVVPWPIERHSQEGTTATPEQQRHSRVPEFHSWVGLLTQKANRALGCILTADPCDESDVDRTASAEEGAGEAPPCCASLLPVVALRTLPRTRDQLQDTTRAAGYIDDVFEDDDDDDLDDEALTAMACSPDGDQAVLATRSGYAYLFRELCRYHDLAETHVAARKTPGTRSEPPRIEEPFWTWLPFGTDTQVVVACEFDATGQYLAVASAVGEVRLYYLPTRTVVQRFRCTKGHGMVTCLRLLRGHEATDTSIGTRLTAMPTDSEKEQRNTEAVHGAGAPDEHAVTAADVSATASLPTVPGSMTVDRSQVDVAGDHPQALLSSSRSPFKGKKSTAAASEQVRQRETCVPPSPPRPSLLLGCEDGTIWALPGSPGARPRSVHEHTSAVLHLQVLGGDQHVHPSHRRVISAGLDTYLLEWDERFGRPHGAVPVGEAITALLPIHRGVHLGGWLIATMSGVVYLLPFSGADTPDAHARHQQVANRTARLVPLLRMESGSVQLIDSSPQTQPGTTFPSKSSDETSSTDTVTVLGFMPWPRSHETSGGLAQPAGIERVLITTSDQCLHLIELSVHHDRHGNRVCRAHVVASVMTNLDEVYSLAPLRLRSAGSRAPALAFATNAHAIAVARIIGVDRVETLCFQRMLRGHCDAVLGLCVPPALPPTSKVGPLAYAPDATLVSVSKDTTVRLWDVDRGVCCGVGRGHTAALSAVTCGWILTRHRWSLWIASAGDDGALKLWTPPGLPSVADHDNDHALATQGMRRDAPLECWCTVAHAHDGEIHCLATAPNAPYLASGSQDKSVKLWRISSDPDGSVQVTAWRMLSGHRRSVWAVCFGHNEPVLASASADRTIRVWSIADGQCLRQLEAGGAAFSSRAPNLGSFLCCSFLAGDSRIVAGSAEGALYQWHWRSGQLLGEIYRCRSMEVPQRSSSSSSSSSIRSRTHESAHQDRLWSLLVIEHDLRDTHLESASTDSNNCSRCSLLVTGGADGRIRCWRDVSAEERARQLVEQEARLQMDQELQRALAMGNFTEALRGAIQLEQPLRAFLILEKMGSGAFAQSPLQHIAAVETVVRALHEPSEVGRLLEYAREWCAQRRTAFTGHLLLRAVFRVHYPPYRLRSLLQAAGYRAEAIDNLKHALIAYAERQARDLLRIQDALQLLPYAEARSGLPERFTGDGTGEASAVPERELARVPDPYGCAT